MQTPIRPLASSVIRKQPSHSHYLARITAILMATLTIGSPVTRAHDAQQSSTRPGVTPSGKILWQFNSNG